MGKTRLLMNVVSLDLWGSSFACERVSALALISKGFHGDAVSSERRQMFVRWAGRLLHVCISIVSQSQRLQSVVHLASLWLLWLFATEQTKNRWGTVRQSDSSHLTVTSTHDQPFTYETWFCVSVISALKTTSLSLEVYPSVFSCPSSFIHCC